MALLEQWRSKRSWFFDGLVAIAGGVIGFGGLLPALVPVSEGTLAAPRDHSWERLPAQVAVMPLVLVAEPTGP